MDTLFRNCFSNIICFVFGIFFDTTSDKKYPSEDFLERFDWENLGEGDVSLPMDFFLNKLPGRKIWRYDGSLTTPPCTEAVSWHVLQEPLYISPDSLSYLEKVIGV